MTSFQVILFINGVISLITSLIVFYNVYKDVSKGTVLFCNPRDGIHERFSNTSRNYYVLNPFKKRVITLLTYLSTGWAIFIFIYRVNVIKYEYNVNTKSF